MASSPALRVFLDANILFSASYASQGIPAHVLDRAIDRAFVPVISGAVLREAIRNLRDKAPAAVPALQLYLEQVDIEIALAAEVDEVERWLEAGLGSDAAHVAAAVKAGVDIFCTGDRRLASRLRAAAPRGLRVVSPRELLDDMARG